WLLGAELLPLAAQIRRHECLGRQASEGPGSRKREAEETAGGGNARARRHARGIEKKVVTAPARREVVRTMKGSGLSERHALGVVNMSAGSARYEPAPDRNAELRQQIVGLAHRYKRYGAGMIYLKLRQQGLVVNHKRVDRLYALEKLQLKKRRRKKVPLADR